jgi:hypothetical protein
MATKRKMKYQVKPEFVGKVKLESARNTIVLDDQTPQAVLEQLYDTVLGKGFIEQVPVKTTAAPQTV